MMETEQREEAETEQSFVSLCYSNTVLGVACYAELEGSICCNAFRVSTECLEESITALKSALRPTLFLIHPVILSNKPLLDLLLAGMDGSPNAFRFKVLKTSAWNDKTCNHMIHNCLEIRDAGSSDNTDSKFSQYQRVSSSVDLDSTQCKQSLGALLAYMQENIFKLDGGKVIISSLRSYVEDQYVQIDQGSFTALQIFAEEVHPNVMRGKGRSKEGFSMFGLFDRTNSLPGRQKLRDWMARPFNDREKILHRQRGVALMSRLCNRDFVTSTCAILRHFHDLPRLILRVKKVEATHTDWNRIVSSLAAAQQLLDHIAAFTGNSMTFAEDIAYLNEIFGSLQVASVHRLCYTLQEAIDTQQSEAEACVVFQEGYDSVLDQMRRVFDHLEVDLVQAAHCVLQVVPTLQNVSVEYVPQVGHLVAVREEEVHLLTHSTNVAANSLEPVDEGEFTAWMEPPRRQDMGFRMVFQQAGVHYFKHNIVEELDMAVGDIKSDIADRQRVLLLQIEDALLAAEAPLQALSGSLSTLDALISLGTLAVEQGLVAPEIVEESVILIKGGKHLLQALSVDNFVPNDTFVSPQKNVALISGPNTSGKSVYLKQVALIVYLAHVGSYVPCERARIGLTDRIFTRISSTESVSTPQSAFALDLQQVSRMLRCHTPRTLCLIDEFGKGTMPVDGIALLAAVVKRFTERGGSALFVLHFTEILHDNVLSAQVMERISCFRMETLALGHSENDMEGDEEYWESTPLFVLKKGVAASSEGLSCAHSAGVNETVLHRAKEVKSKVSSHQTMQPTLFRNRGIQHNHVHLELLKVFLDNRLWQSKEGEAALDTLYKIM